MLGIRKSRTSPYHPQGDAQPERFNRTLLAMLGTMDTAKKQCWSQHITHLVHTYNCTRSDATGYSPYYLMFGREARLPIDVCFGISPNGESESSYQQYVSRMRKELQDAYKLASDAATKNHLRNKAHYDQRVRDLPLEKGDRVLIQNVGIKGKHKLQDHWKSTPYVVVEKLPNLPVYKVKPEHGPGVLKTLHRDHLLPIGYMVRMPNPSDDTGHIKRPVTRAHRAQKSQAVKPPDPVEESDTASSDEMFEAVHNPQSFGVQEVRRQLATPHQTSEEDDTSEEEHFEAAESQPVEESESENSSGDDTPTMLEYDAQETNESMGEQEEERETSSPFSNRTRSDSSHRSTRNESEQFSTSRKSLRKPKPPLRLTYEKPGHPSCEPVTIMHHGMVIQLKLNPPDISEPKGHSKTSKKFLGSEEDHHPVKLKKSQRCDEDIYTVRRGRV